MADEWDQFPDAPGLSVGAGGDPWAQFPDAAPKTKPDVATDIVKGLGYGANEGMDATLNLIGAPVRAPVNFVSRQLGYGDVIPELQLFRRANVAPPETTAGRTAQAIGEVAGSSVAPSGALATAGRVAASSAPRLARAPEIIRGYATRPGRALATDAAAATGSGLGIAAARENDLGPVGEIGLGLAGGFLAPNALNVASRGVDAVQGTARYTNRLLARSRNPQMAADQDTVDALLKAGVSPQQLYNEFAPPTSSNLQGRGISQEKMAEVLSRQAQGEAIDDLAREIGVAPKTLSGYVQQWKRMNPTPRNIADATQDIANVGGAQPILRLGRAAYGIADDAQASQALTARQNDQYGRMVNIINRAGGNRDYDSTIQAIDDALGDQSKKAYGLAHQNEQPFDLSADIRRARKAAFESAGPLREKMEAAVDLFFEPVIGPDGRVASLGQPISDVKRYQAAREGLSQMIETSYHDNKPTTLTRKLTQLRRMFNATVRQANPLLAAADDQFSGAKSTQELLKRGDDLVTQLGAKQDEFFKLYKTLTPDQREIVRLGFLRKLANRAAKPQEGAAVANQFRSNEVRQTIRKLFIPDSPPKNMTDAQRKAFAARSKEIRKAGEDLIRGGTREATTTNTLNFITNRGNTQTAPWARDMEQMQQGAELVGDVATLNWLGVLRKTGRKLASQMGEETSRRVLDNITNTDPATVLSTLRRLAKEAKTAKERQAYVIALREFGRVGRRPGVDIGSFLTGNESPETEN